jgi:hypothetical protein
MDMTPTLEAKSDQLNADDLISGPRTITVTEVLPTNDPKQPVIFHFDGDNGRSYRPNKTMRRIIVAAWGPQSTVYTGRFLTLYRNPEVVYGSERVGGIEISHMSDIAGPVSIALTVRRGKKSIFTVQPLKVAPPAPAPTTDPVAAAAEACERAGLTAAGIEALCLKASDGAHTSLADLHESTLVYIVRNGIDAEKVAAFNATAEPAPAETAPAPAGWAD